MDMKTEMKLARRALRVHGRKQVAADAIRLAALDLATAGVKDPWGAITTARQTIGAINGGDDSTLRRGRLTRWHSGWCECAACRRKELFNQRANADFFRLMKWR